MKKLFLPRSEIQRRTSVHFIFYFYGLILMKGASYTSVLSFKNANSIFPKFFLSFLRISTSLPSMADSFIVDSLHTIRRVKTNNTLLSISLNILIDLKQLLFAIIKKIYTFVGRKPNCLHVVST